MVMPTTPPFLNSGAGVHDEYMGSFCVVGRSRAHRDVANTFFLPRHLLPKRHQGSESVNPVHQPAEPEAV